MSSEIYVCLFFNYSDVKVPVPQPYEVIKKVPYEVKYEVAVPKPYTVIKKVPYEVKEYVDKVRCNKNVTAETNYSNKTFTAIQSVCGQTLSRRS